MPAKVSLVRCSSYQNEEVLSSLRKSLNLLGGISLFVKHGQKVLLKVNMLGPYSPQSAVITHPGFLKAVIHLVKDAGGKPYVGDSPGFDDPKRSSEVCQYQKVCKETHTPFAYFKDAIEVKNPSGRRFKSYWIAKEALEADVIINLPKFKTHGLTGITSAVKNMFGCVPGLLKSEYHMKVPDRNNFSLMLLDILAVVKPVLNIVDAVVGADGEGGASAGKPKRLNLIAASADAVAVDEVLCEVVGIDPLTIPTNKIAHDNSLAPEQIEVVGEKIEDVKCPDFKAILLLPEQVFPGPPLIKRFAKLFLLEKPVVIKDKCTSCRVCERVCKSKAISFPGKYPTYDYEKCIRCFCCAEMCPEQAIKIKSNPLIGFLFVVYMKLKELKSRLFAKS